MEKYIENIYQFLIKIGKYKFVFNLWKCNE